MGNKSTVTVTDSGEFREYPVEQAERLLTMNIPGGSGWKLADEGWEMVDGRLTRKAKKENAKKEK